MQLHHVIISHQGYILCLPLIYSHGKLNSEDWCPG